MALSKRIFQCSKHIDAYTQKGRKRHFERNGGGLESKFDRLRKSRISVFLQMGYTMLYLHSGFKYSVV